ncbi:MAG: hypothetical protein II841_04770 [Bacteroidales bacterium]|nr:hypothetical protein [Bacteroidales bacterium]
METHTHDTDFRKLPTDAVLTKAETRIACGYVAGMVGKEIADTCGVSYNTVARHTQHIYDKARIGRSTNALVAWFLERNFNLDLSEFRRRVGALVLLCLFGWQVACTDFDNTVLLRSGRRTEARRAGGRRSRREDENDTLDLFTI